MWRKFFASHIEPEAAFLGSFVSFSEAHHFARRHTDRVGYNKAHVDWQCAQSFHAGSLPALTSRLEAVARPGMRIALLGGQRLRADVANCRLASANLNKISWIELPEQNPSPPYVNVQFGGVVTCDVLLADGALPYWNQALQAELVDHDARPAHLVLDSLSLTEASAFVTLHKVAGRVAPYLVDNDQHFVEQLCGLGYRLNKRWRNNDIDIGIPLANRCAELALGMHLKYSGAG